MHLNSADADLLSRCTVTADLELEAEIGGHEVAGRHRDRIDRTYADVAEFVGGRPAEVTLFDNATPARRAHEEEVTTAGHSRSHHRRAQKQVKKFMRGADPTTSTCPRQNMATPALAMAAAGIYGDYPTGALGVIGVTVSAVLFVTRACRSRS